MAFMNESTADGPGATVQIFVRTPRGKIDIPVMHLQLEIAGGMCKVKPNNTSFSMPCLGDRSHIEGLARVIVDGAEKNECDRVAFTVDQFENVFRSQRRFPC